MSFNQDIIRNNHIFFLGFFIFVFTGLATTQFYGRDELHLFINGFFSSYTDIFFKYFSKIATITFVAAILFFIIKKETYKTLFVLLSGYGLSFIIGTFVKRYFFVHVHRPTYYFSQKGIDLHLIEGVTSQIPYTFPSGHTADAFLLMLFVCIVTKSNWIQIMALILAVTMAMSRVYLSKHFVIDTVGGAFLGVFCLTITYYAFQNKNSAFLNQKIISQR